MNLSNINRLIAGDDKMVDIGSKQNISALDYVNYLVSCMIPAGFTTEQRDNADIYALTLHDDTTISNDDETDLGVSGSYFKVTRISHTIDRPDAFQIDIGFGNTGTIVTDFKVVNDENYSLLYDYSESQPKNNYVYRLDNSGNMNEI
jgi:hypothetical protein